MIQHYLWIVLCAMSVHGLYAQDDLQLSVLSTYHTGVFDEGAAEIVSYDPISQRAFFTNANDNSVGILDISDPSAPTLVSEIDLSAYGGGVNSLDVYDGIVAVAVEAEIKQENGSVVFFDTDGSYLNDVEVGALPDMVIFSPDGQYVITANEGEPNDDYTVDPEGSVSIIDISGGVSAATHTLVDFTAFNDLKTSLQSKGVRIYGPNATVAQDLEPEYITISGNTIYAALQENNALAVIDLTTKSVTEIVALGTKDHSLPGNGMDASNETEEINITTWPVQGYYLPDAITSVEIDGETYILSANEGDSRDYDGYSEEERVADLTLDPTAFPNAAELQDDTNLGRLKTTSANGDLDGDGDHDIIYSYGARSFSIWDANGNQVWDSGDAFETVLAEVEPANFNSTNDENDSYKNRSDDKGPEPEAIEVAVIDDKIYAMIGLERQGGIMVYDISTPSAPQYVTYVNNRDFSVEDVTTPAVGDLGTEDIVYISPEDSPTGQALVLTANEVSGTVTIFGLGEEPIAPPAPTCAEVTIRSYFTDGNPYGLTGNPIYLYVDRRGAIPSEAPITYGPMSDGDLVCLPVGSTFRVDIFDRDIELDNGARYIRTGYFYGGGLRSQVVTNTAESSIHIVYKLTNEADTTDTPDMGADEMVSLLAQFDTGIFDEEAAEIVAHDPATQTLIYTNGFENVLGRIDIADPKQPIALDAIDMSPYGTDITSVDIHDGIVAVAVVGETKQDPGSVVFLDVEGNLLNQVTAGALPDMVTFSPDGQTVLAANEGEPNDDYTVDPEGSVTVVDISGGVEAATATQITFEKYNELQVILNAQGIRIFGPGATVAQDLEPEYITVTPDGKYAFVGMQENNAMAKIDLAKMEVVDLFPLGLKDHKIEGRGLDASDKTDEINIATWPIFGMYQPDAIKSYVAADGETYIITANEGDARDYDGYSEEARVEDLTLESANYPDAAELQTDEQIGRMKTTTATGDANGDGEIDFIHTYGGRSFSIWDTECKQIWDSGDQFEQILATEAAEFFNSTNDDNDSFKNRSDDKGPEPEAIEVMAMGDKIYALVGLERQGGVVIYDITVPTAPQYISYFNNRDFSADIETPAAGDLGIEDIRFIATEDSPTGQPLIVTANEVSGTISIFGVTEEGITASALPVAEEYIKKSRLKDNAAELSVAEVSSYPNPFADEITIELNIAKRAQVDINIYAPDGQNIQQVKSEIMDQGNYQITPNVTTLSSGVYFLEVVIDGKKAIHKLTRA